MGLDTRTAQTVLENALRDVILQALGVRLPAVATVAALRAFQTMGPSGTSMRSDDDLVYISGSSITSYRWNSISTVADNGAGVIKPNDVTANGRWVQWTSNVRFSTTVGGNSITLDQVSSGPLAQVILVDKRYTKDEMANLIVGQVPAVIIEAHGDDPEDVVLDLGSKWVTRYEFTVTAIAENLRDRREAAQGSTVPGDSTYGANTIDGFIKGLLAGTVLNDHGAFSDHPVQNVAFGRGRNEFSDDEMLQRYVFRSRDYVLQVSEEMPPAPNDVYQPTDAFVQAYLTDLHQQATYDPNNYLISGINPTLGGNLAQTLPAGTAQIAGSTVAYAGGAVSFTAWSDVYRDLAPNGTLTLTAVNRGGVPPAQTAGTLRIGFTSTNATIVLADTLIAMQRAAFGPDNDFPI
jgi:hypothetical protein